MSVTTNKSSYNFGELVTINGQGAESYSISIIILSPSDEEITELSTFKTSAGEFSTIWIIPSGIEKGMYTINARDSTQTAQTTFTLGNVEVEPQPEQKSGTSIPDWVKNVAEFWVIDQIDDASFVQVIEYLVNQGIISIPYAEAPEGEAAVNIPIWIKTSTEFWVSGSISDDEFAIGLEWMINNGIIRI